jgi:hypothetical protein
MVTKGLDAYRIIKRKYAFKRETEVTQSLVIAIVYLPFILLHLLHLPSDIVVSEQGTVISYYRPG